jgi:hypothetical protein
MYIGYYSSSNSQELCGTATYITTMIALTRLALPGQEPSSIPLIKHVFERLLFGGDLPDGYQPAPGLRLPC